jgi:hypothetical protein
MTYPTYPRRHRRRRRPDRGPRAQARRSFRVEEGALGLPIPVTLKLEHTQVTGSFKVRGAFNNMLSREVPPAGVVAASGGNHGAAVAYAATELGPCVPIYVPKSIAKEEKLRRMRMFGGEVILTEGSVAECMAEYAAAAESTGALSVHPYDTAWTLAGQGTVAREIRGPDGRPRVHRHDPRRDGRRRPDRRHRGVVRGPGQRRLGGDGGHRHARPLPPRGAGDRRRRLRHRGGLAGRATPRRHNRGR